MHPNHAAGILACIILLTAVITAGCITNETGGTDGTQTVTDVFGRTVIVPANLTNVATAGSATARFMVYVDAQNAITSVDLGETRPSRLTYEPRPFALANRQFITMPAITDAKTVLPEQLLNLSPQLLILGSESAAGMAEADKITEKTGIPVVMIDETADLGTKRDRFDANIHLLAKLFGKEQRADEFLTYINETIADLNRRTKDIPDSAKPTVYIGGVAYSGAHGLTYTEPNYPPFQYVNIENAAAGTDKSTTLAVEIAKEKLLEWNPDIIFVDAATLRYTADLNAFESLSNDSLYSGMTAVKNNAVYTAIPYVWNGVNHESSLANAYYVGKVLFPEQFADIDPAKKTDEIYEHFVGKPVFAALNGFINNTGFTRYVL
ncbi:MAG: ABC transporter substrate-binding protein [Methanocorpusculum sp.]|nr:ABC transporter substrate-binding protein [Methanocorpusculum sp.]